VKIPGSELALARRRGAPRTVIDLIGEVKDDYGITVQKTYATSSTSSSRTTPPRNSQHGRCSTKTGFTLLPGKYVIKLLARDDETGRVGTYQASFAVPNLNRELQRVPISTVVLSSHALPLSDALYKRQAEGRRRSGQPARARRQKLVPT